MKKILVTFCASALAWSAVQAQQPQTLHLGLEEAIRIALDENPTIQVADLEVERYDYVRRETRGNLLPSLSVSGTYTRSIVKSEMAKGLSFGADNTIAATADIALPLFAPSVYSTLRMNRTQMEAAVESARSSRIDLVNAVKKAYYNILLAEQSLEVLRASERNVEQTVENTRNMYRNGLTAEYDLITAEVQLSNLQPSILQTENSIKVSKLMLKMYLSLPQQIDVVLTGTLDDFRSQVLGDGELSTDISRNSELRSMEIQERLLDDQLRVAQAARLPIVSAFGQFTLTGNDMSRFSLGDLTGDGTTGGGSAASSGANSFWWQHPISAGVQVSIPIFSGLKNTSRVKQLRNSVSQMQLQRDYLAQNIEVEVRSSINDLLTARESMFANEKTVEQARKAYEISEVRYKAGAGTILELNSAELALTQARLNYSQSIFDYLSARADYERVIGADF